MNIDRWTHEKYSHDKDHDGAWVLYEDHAELMADLQRRLDETEALLADAKAQQGDLEERLDRAERDAADLQAALYTDTYPGV